MEIKKHQWFFEKSFSCSESYDQFINWLRAEFYFFQQDQGTCITIYFPNGKLLVNKENSHDRTIVSKITVESKCKRVGLKIRKNFSEFLDHIEKYHKLNQM